MSEKRFGYILPISRDTFDAKVVARLVEDASWDEFRTLTKVVEDLRPTAIDFLSLEQEYEEFSRAHIDVANAWAETNVAEIAGSHIGGAYVTAQRRLSNFLGAASSFRSRVQTRLEAPPSIGGITAKAWQHQISKIYDASFAYRLLYNLRNYAQHHDSPVSLIPVKGVRDADGSMSFDVKLMLNRSELAKSSRIQAKVRKEIDRLDAEAWDLLPLAREYFQCHSKLMAWLLAHELPRLADMQRYREAVVRVFAVPPGGIPVIWEGTGPIKGGNARVHHFSFEELDVLMALMDRIHLLVSGISP